MTTQTKDKQEKKKFDTKSRKNKVLKIQKEKVLCKNTGIRQKKR